MLTPFENIICIFLSKSKIIYVMKKLATRAICASDLASSVDYMCKI
jgi:hypothetical protein